MGTMQKTTFEDVWTSIKELSETQKKTDCQIKELGQSQAETDCQIKELRQSQAETGCQIKELRQSQAETGCQIKELRHSQAETDRQIKETGKQLKKTDAHFNTQWGRLVESLVEGDLVKRLNERGIPVQRTVTNGKSTFEQQEYEYDVIAINGDQVIVVEIKTTLKSNDVGHFIKKLNVFKKFFPEYSGKKVYGAVAYIRSDSGSVKYSEKNGLFIIRATGNSSRITNAEGFIPQSF